MKLLIGDEALQKNPGATYPIMPTLPVNFERVPRRRLARKEGVQKEIAAAESIVQSFLRQEGILFYVVTVLFLTETRRLVSSNDGPSNLTWA
jgi:hypothetical protein